MDNTIAASCLLWSCTSQTVMSAPRKKFRTSSPVSPLNYTRFSLAHLILILIPLWMHNAMQLQCMTLHVDWVRRKRHHAQ